MASVVVFAVSPSTELMPRVKVVGAGLTEVHWGDVPAVRRLADDGSDTSIIEAHFLGCEFHFRKDQVRVVS